MKIPKGYHRLRKGCYIQKGDKYLAFLDNKWHKTINTYCDGMKIGDTCAHIYIRKNKS